MLLLPLLLLLQTLMAQSRPESAVAPRIVTIQNLAPFARSEWSAVVVPFAKGTQTALPTLRLGDLPTIWQPTGARWPDGSLRTALALARVTVAAQAELALALGPGAPAAAAEPVAPQELDLQIVAMVAGKQHAAQPRLVRELERNAARCVSVHRCRVGESGLVAEITLTRWREQAHGEITVGVFFSDPDAPDLQRSVELLLLESRGQAVLLRHPGPCALTTEFTPTGSRTTLLRDQVLGDGQGIRRAGVFVPALRGEPGHDDTIRANAIAPLLAATDWRGSGAYGAFGEPPEVPPWLQGPRLRAALAARHREFVQRSQHQGAPFFAPALGPAARAGQTGDQEDFGVSKLGAVAATGVPSFLLEAELAALQEACRPVHFYERDASPVLPERHPGWVVWSGRTHWHPEISKDRLGKPVPEPQFESHGWTGKDRQHWSSNLLGGFALLTAAPWARLELENEARLVLAGETVTPGLSTSGPDAPRAVGRTLLAATWGYLVTGDQQLLARLHERVAKVYAHVWEGRNLPEGKVRPFSWETPDARMLDGKTPYWTPWQDALAAVGLVALDRVDPDPIARDIGLTLARNMVRHGWLLDAQGGAFLATAMRWNEGGEPLRPEEVTQGAKRDVVWSHGTAYSVWALGAVELARGEADTAERAAEIQRRVRAGRTPPRDGWFDRFGEWDAIRLPRQ